MAAVEDKRAPSPNRFDNLCIDVPRLYETCPIDAKIDPRPSGVRGAVPGADSWLSRIYRSPLIPFGVRQRIWGIAHRTRLDVEWFERFRRYWSQSLGGRPLWTPDDLVFLKNWYRVKFQKTLVPDDADALGHLAAWQSPDLIYQLLHLAHKSSVLNEARLLQKLFNHRPQPKAILEFGCGTAPIAHSLFQFFPPDPGLVYYLSDLQSLSFHYAAWQYRSCKNVIAVPLRPEGGFLFDRDVQLDAICCITVLEHLPAPLKVIEHFHRLLRPGGVLLFDYIKGEGDGMDTIQAVRERGAVLEFVGKHFRLLEGELSESRSMGVTIVRK